VFIWVCLADRALKFEFEPSDEARVFVEVMVARKFSQRICQFKVIHADCATGMAFRGNV
jgi:hypothetical protein